MRRNVSAVEERLVIEVMTSDRQLKASREGSKSRGTVQPLPRQQGLKAAPVRICRRGGQTVSDDKADEGEGVATLSVKGDRTVNDVSVEGGWTVKAVSVKGGTYLPSRLVLGFLDKGIQTPMAQGRSAKIVSMIKWIRTSRLLIKNSLCATGSVRFSRFRANNKHFKNV